MSGGIGGTSTQFEAATDDNSAGGITGSLTIDTAGHGVLDAHTKVPGANMKVSWCNFPGTAGCFDIGSFNGDNSGEIKGSFTFPQHGNFAGTFGLIEGGVNVFFADFDVPNRETPFQAIMLSAASITAGLGTATAQDGVGNDSLSSGAVSVPASSPMAHMELHGVPASQSYSVSLCGNGGNVSDTGELQHGCIHLANFSSDASGNAVVDVDMTTVTSIITVTGTFVVRRPMASQSPIEFVSGFRVP